MCIRDRNSLSLDRQFSQYIYKVFLDGFVILDGLREGNVYHFIVVNAYHDIALSLSLIHILRPIMTRFGNAT